MTITNKAFRQAMEKAGLGKIELCKNKNYFYIYSEDEKMMNEILSRVENNMILCHAFNDMTVDGWVDAIRSLFGYERDELASDLWKANTELPKGIMIFEKSTIYTYHPGFVLNLPATGNINADRALDFAEEIQKAVLLLNQLNNKYKGRKIFF